MRLIDVDKITDERGKINGIIECDENGMYIRLNDLLNLLDDEPTAYDVEKVVKQLESEIELKVTQYPLHGTYIKKSRAIDIVKAGGADES